MRAKEARKLGEHLADIIDDGNIEEAYDKLEPIVAKKTPFRILDLVGKAVGAGKKDSVDTFISHIASHKTMGGWVIIASALGEWLPDDMSAALIRCREITISADVWYATDILGERVPGPALVADFDQALALLGPWRNDENPWMRRMVGVAIHFWAKRSKDKPELISRVPDLLDFLEPTFEEWNIDAVKGIGWSLKTLGRYYPDITAPWLARQKDRPHRAIMMKKATTYFSEKHKVLVMES